MDIYTAYNPIAHVLVLDRMEAELDEATLDQWMRAEREVFPIDSRAPESLAHRALEAALATGPRYFPGYHGITELGW